MIKPFTAYLSNLPQAYLWSVHCQNPAFICKLEIKAPILHLALSLLSQPLATTPLWKVQSLFYYTAAMSWESWRLDEERESSKGDRERAMEDRARAPGVWRLPSQESSMFSGRQWPVRKSWLNHSFRIFYTYHYQERMEGRNTGQELQNIISHSLYIITSLSRTCEIGILVLSKPLDYHGNESHKSHVKFPLGEPCTSLFSFK